MTDDLPVVPAVVKPDVNAALETMRAFQSLKAKLLDKDDTIIISQKTAIKRSGWRKISLAFGITTEIMQVERSEQDGKLVVRVRARATAPNGRAAEDLGVCDASEFETGRLKATLHNVESKAATRAINRAISDLVGGGEVSAEEMIQGEEKSAQPTQTEEPSTEPTPPGQDEADESAKLEAELEALPWVEAASKKCDFMRDAPAELVEKVRAAKGGIKGQTHHFTVSNNELTLFRFGRGAKA